MKCHQYMNSVSRGRQEGIVEMSQGSGCSSEERKVSTLSDGADIVMDGEPALPYHHFRKLIKLAFEETESNK